MILKEYLGKAKRVLYTAGNRKTPSMMREVRLALSDQHQYLGNCPPTPPLIEQQSIDYKLGLMLG